ncbi:MAG: hypothetical protein AAFV43_15715 [Planctomycetota bacterium]
MSDDTPTVRFRLSLFSLLLLMALAAALLTIVVLLRDIAPLRRQLRQANDEIRMLRDEVGELTITDRSKVHAVEVDTEIDGRWKWRVWIPEGLRCDVRFVGANVPANGFPAQSDRARRLGPGEHTIEFRLGTPEPTGARVASIHVERAIKATRVGWSHPRWVITRGVGRETRGYNPAKPVLLQRHRVSNEANPSGVKTPTDGFMIWLEPVP